AHRVPKLRATGRSRPKIRRMLRGNNSLSTPQPAPTCTANNTIGANIPAGPCLRANVTPATATVAEYAKAVKQKRVANGGATKPSTKATARKLKNKAGTNGGTANVSGCLNSNLARPRP